MSKIPKFKLGDKVGIGFNGFTGHVEQISKYPDNALYLVNNEWFFEDELVEDSNTSKQVILNKEYYCETLLDLESDIEDSLNTSNIPKDDAGFYEGKFIVTVEWVKEE